VRRLGSILAVAVALTMPATAGAAWRPHMHDAEVYAKGRRGDIAFSVRTPGKVWGWRATRTYPSASVLKAMLMVADLNRDHPDRDLLKPMITRSDNNAAGRVLGIVGTKGLRQVARRAGMTNFTPVTPVWGNSKVTAEDQSRFFLKIDSLIPKRNRAYGMKLLASIVPSQRWGIGAVAPAGWKLYFKGGWGSGTGRVDHQVALLVKGDQRVSIAMMTAADGTHAYGKETLRGLAKRLVRGL
jgi:beta-lactamase class A